MNLTKKRKPKEEVNLLKANNALRTNYVNAKIDYSRKCSLCDDREETINPKKGECSKLALCYIIKE